MKVQIVDKKRDAVSRQQAHTILSLLILTPIGFYSKFYHGPAFFWVNNSLGGALYEIFWCLFFLLIFPKAKPAIIATTVFTVTCVLEFMQLWHPPFLEFIRRYFIGRTLIGTSFTWSDFPYYAIGSAVGWLWMAGLARLGQKAGPSEGGGE